MSSKQPIITLEVGELSTFTEKALEEAGCTLEHIHYDREHPENEGNVKIKFPEGATQERRQPTTLDEHMTIWVGEHRFFAQLSRFTGNSLWYSLEPLIF